MLVSQQKVHIEGTAVLADPSCYCCATMREADLLKKALPLMAGALDRSKKRCN